MQEGKMMDCYGVTAIAGAVKTCAISAMFAVIGWAMFKYVIGPATSRPDDNDY